MMLIKVRIEEANKRRIFRCEAYVGTRIKKLKLKALFAVTVATVKCGVFKLWFAADYRICGALASD